MAGAGCADGLCYLSLPQEYPEAAQVHQSRPGWMAAKRRKLYPADGDPADDPLSDDECRRYGASIPGIWPLWRPSYRGLCPFEVAASAIKRLEQRFPGSPGKDLLVAAYHGYPGLPQLPSVFQTPSYPAGFSKCLVCPPGT